MCLMQNFESVLPKSCSFYSIRDWAVPYGFIFIRYFFCSPSCKKRNMQPLYRTSYPLLLDLLGYPMSRMCISKTAQATRTGEIQKWVYIVLFLRQPENGARLKSLSLWTAEAIFSLKGKNDLTTSPRNDCLLCLNADVKHFTFECLENAEVTITNSCQLL